MVERDRSGRAAILAAYRLLGFPAAFRRHPSMDKMHGSFNDEIAVVAELADAQASGACGRNAVEVQVLSTALKK